MAFSFSETAKRHVPSVLFGSYTLCAGAGMLDGGAWAAFGIAGALLAALFAWAGGGKFPWPDRSLGLFMALFLVVATAISLLSPYRDLALHSTVKLVTIFLPLCLFSSPRVLDAGEALGAEKSALGAMTGFGAALLSLTLFVATQKYGFESAEMTKLNRGLSYGLMLAAPVLALLKGGREKVFLLVPLGVALVLTHSRAAQMAALAALAIFAVARLWPEFVRRGLALCVAASFIWPLGARILFSFFRESVALLPPSWGHRVEIWDYLSHRTEERFFFGWGVGVSHKLDWIEPNGPLYHYTPMPAAHPHNAIVQIWVETGFLGIVLAGVACLWIFRSLGKVAPAHRPYALAAIAAGAVLLLSAYNFWTDSLWAAMALTLFLFASSSRKLNNS